MERVTKAFTETFDRFVRSEQSSSILLVLSTLIALALTNSSVGPTYSAFWQLQVGGMSLEHWVNDALMAVFFLLIGLELERELYVGELSEPRKALLPIVAAIGGMAAPALIHFGFNAGSSTQDGIGIPMATDIAFALGALALLGKRIPTALKVFVVAFAVMDDLGAIVVIAVFYTAQLSVAYLVGALAVWGLLITLNRFFRIMALAPYLLGGAVMWVLVLKSGVHATIAGVLLAFAIPFSGTQGPSPSHRLEHALHRPVAFLILPIFALANAGILVGADWLQDLTSSNSVGIFTGLVIGKPLGVVLCCLLATYVGLCKLPPDLGWAHILGAGMLGGIGFTMSIFIANLAFPADTDVVNASKMTIMLASLTAGIAGFIWLRYLARPAIESV
jgi:Na+:H+ antiporter, NhaA family